MNKEESSIGFLEGGNKNERCQMLVSCHRDTTAKSWKQVSQNLI